MSIEVAGGRLGKLDLSGSVAPQPMPLPDMPATVWANPNVLRSRFHKEALRFFDCEAVLPVTGIESGISGLARLFQTWYGSMRVVLAEPSFDQWDKRFRRASHVVLDWPAELILEGEIPDCDVVVLGRPVNPTGQMSTLTQIQPLAQRLREQGGWLILDEAYLDWTGESSYTGHIKECPAIVLRSVAPFLGLAGANLAFVCAPQAVCTALLNEVGTQAVSSPQWWLALQYFAATDWRQQQIGLLKAQLQRLSQLWQQHSEWGDTECKLGGYFVCFAHPKGEQWAAKLEAMGILVRYYPIEEPMVRCGLPRNENEWLRLADAIAAL
ncbi:aminotransferase class I/II-fold pyridoxal phosphate-dependent enzyme [Limnobacter sp.]|uniref:aminotransferase class I/II-fold pyridoxal phosphate-dependent enzyme n=1 Tax=Limnobacter sp. TaxID=2003368 RepID=UPI0035186F05